MLRWCVGYVTDLMSHLTPDLVETDSPLRIAVLQADLVLHAASTNLTVPLHASLADALAEAIANHNHSLTQGKLAALEHTALLRWTNCKEF